MNEEKDYAKELRIFSLSKILENCFDNWASEASERLNVYDSVLSMLVCFLVYSLQFYRKFR